MIQTALRVFVFVFFFLMTVRKNKQTKQLPLRSPGHHVYQQGVSSSGNRGEEFDAWPIEKKLTKILKLDRRGWPIGCNRNLPTAKTNAAQHYPAHDLLFEADILQTGRKEYCEQESL